MVEKNLNNYLNLLKKILIFNKFVKFIFINIFLFIFFTGLSNKTPISKANQDITKTTDSILQEALRRLSLLQNIEGQEEAFLKYDKIITFENKVIVCKIKQITDKEIKFLFPLNTEIVTISRKNISQIVYGNGIIDLFFPFDEENVDSLNLPVERIILDETKEWEKITILTEQSQLDKLESLGNVTIIYESPRQKISNNDLEKIAIMLLKKKVVAKNGTCALIHSKNIERNYGTLPSIKIKATIFKEKNITTFDF